MITPSRFLSALRRWRRHPWPARLALVRATGAVGAMWVALRVVPFARLVDWTRLDAERLPRPSNHDLVVRRIVWAVEAVAPRLLPARPCLPQALAARALLARRGVATTFHIGVAATPAAGLQAHAWLERDGQVLVGGADAPTRYVRLVGRAVPSLSQF